MFLNAVYEADTLISAMENRAKKYENLRERLLVLKKTFNQVSHSGDEFKGAGAKVIKTFYQEQAAIVDEWLTFIDMQIAFFQGVSADAAELKLSGHTYVDIDFLERDLVNGYRRANAMVSDQKQELTGILRSISDLVDLQPFDTGTFEAHLDKAEKERKTTIDKVDELNEKLTYEYQRSEAIQDHIRSRFKALNHATRQGGQASPIYFDAKAYHNSVAYNMKDSVQHQAKSYLSFKKEQSEKRRIEKLQQELKTPNLSLDEYLKIAKDLGEENLTSEQRKIIDLIKANKQQGEILKGVGAGLWEFTKDTAVGLWNVLMTPPEQVLYDMGAAVINYEETYAQISAAIANSYERDMVNGNDYTRARWVTYAIATVGTSLVGTKGADKVGKAGFAAGKNTVKNVKEAAAHELNQMNNSSCFAFRYGFAGGIEGVPFNVVDSTNLKNQLITKASSYSFNDDYGNTKTINLRMGHMKNDVHPITKVPYDKDGFPIFEVKYTLYLDKKDFKKDRTPQFKILNKQLYNQVTNDPNLIKELKLDEDDLIDLKAGKTPEKYTWHHHQKPGRMELVDSEIHSKTGHTGGQKIWGKDSG
ncbi:T7SS effector LXG polymorphic toxin [Bacillus sp. V2I10]|uniref:T7SS effector LXG polymorphic toxin n=1 Tax=Bacillus sp. V2I10 TaxID=3042276 RepID=UPI002780779C|nr:T7SS effector LXG polymorphic toxin [Bacillus sp. V2I10]MDQ0860820.1 putative ribonuclease toxin of YeeF-YezG toxin-antitoxin module [Bacillus sp. V2I10]